MGEDHFRQIEHRGRTATAILSVVREASQVERERSTELMVDQHGDEIEFLPQIAAHRVCHLIVQILGHVGGVEVAVEMGGVALDDHPTARRVRFPASPFPPNEVQKRSREAGQNIVVAVAVAQHRCGYRENDTNANDETAAPTTGSTPPLTIRPVRAIHEFIRSGTSSGRGQRK